jgi:hypothetical protein
LFVVVEAGVLDGVRGSLSACDDRLLCFPRKFLIMRLRLSLRTADEGRGKGPEGGGGGSIRAQQSVEVGEFLVCRKLRDVISIQCWVIEIGAVPKNPTCPLGSRYCMY